MNQEELRQRRERYLQLVRDGYNFTQAAAMVGVSKRTGKVWRNGRTRASGRNEAPSMNWYSGDVPEPTPLHPRYLNETERITIADMYHAGYSIRAIGKALGRAASTISREIKRNWHPLAAEYRPYAADQAAKARQKRPKTPKIIANPDLLSLVKDKLAQHWSPEQISAWLTITYPDNKSMNLCPETIYQAIYVQAKNQLKLEVNRALRSGKTRRTPRNTSQERTPRFRDPMVMISQRPASIEDRAIPGHWEGDLILGAGNKSAIGTLVERQTRFTVLLHLPTDHSALSVQQAIIKKMSTFPKLLRNSLTWDQGSEMALHKPITTALDMQVYFCDPHSPWQRGTNENTNRLLRQYFPKGMDLSQFSEAYLDTVAEELNDRPRKTLNWAKPSQKVLELLS